ncbi:MAG TPA: hypothetical protein VHF22_03250, partial [Planctomycetota bacterium]|nr:hypothetical protein [Planctomycetota bacterium]
ATSVTCEATLDATAPPPAGEPLSVDRPAAATIDFEGGSQDWNLCGKTAWSIALGPGDALVTRRDSGADLADLGEGALDGAAFPARGDPRWTAAAATGADRARAPLRAGHTYAFLSSSGLGVLVRVLSTGPGPTARIRWRIAFDRRLRG